MVSGKNQGKLLTKRQLIAAAEEFEEKARKLVSDSIDRAHGATQVQRVGRGFTISTPADMNNIFDVVLGEFKKAASLRAKAGDVKGAFNAYDKGIRAFTDLKDNTWLFPSERACKTKTAFENARRRLFLLIQKPLPARIARKIAHKGKRLLARTRRIL